MFVCFVVEVYLRLVLIIWRTFDDIGLLNPLKTSSTVIAFYTYSLTPAEMCVPVQSNLQTGGTVVVSRQ